MSEEKKPHFVMTCQKTDEPIALFGPLLYRDGPDRDQRKNLDMPPDLLLPPEDDQQ